MTPWEEYKFKCDREKQHAQDWINKWLNGKTLQEANIWDLLFLEKRAEKHAKAVFEIKEDAVLNEYFAMLQEIQYAEECAIHVIHEELKRRDDLAREAEKRNENAQGLMRYSEIFSV